jgi:hypothetical protein
MKTFQDYINNAPEAYIKLLQYCSGSPERPDYHPERDLLSHIEIVFLNALYYAKNKNLIMAALLHDLCKPCSGVFKSVQIDGKVYEYWSNPYHAQEASRFIEQNESVQQWIEQNNANVQTVQYLVHEHMKFKSYVQGEKGLKGGMKETKRIKYAEKAGNLLSLQRDFNLCDDMLLTKKVNPSYIPARLWDNNLD